MVNVERERLKAGWRRWNAAGFGALALVTVLLTLFAGETIGLSNNGDFARVMGASSLSFGEALPSHTYVDTYVIDLSRGSAGANLSAILFGGEGLDAYPSLHIALVRLSVAVELVVNKLLGWEMSTYHLAVLGVLHTLLYAAAIWFLYRQVNLKRVWADALLKAAGLFVLCDVGYTAYFNSFYSEGLEHIMLVFSAGALLRAFTREEPTGWDALWCALAALGYGWAKFFNIPVAILLAAVGGGAVFLRSKKRLALAAGGGAILALLAVWAVVPGWMDAQTNYNALFFGILRDVDRPTAQEYLTDMGLPAELADFRDTNYYMDYVWPQLESRGLRQAAESIGKGDLLKFYLTHPKRLAHQANLTAQHCGMVRPFYLANYGGDHPAMSLTGRMSGWSALRDRLALDTLWGNLAAVAACLLLAAAAWRKKTKPTWLALGLVTLLGALGYTFLLPVMLNGEGDFAKHMFAYIELLDLALLGTLALCLQGGTETAAPTWLRRGVGAALGLALALPMIVSPLRGLVRDSRSHPGLEPGAYVSLGGHLWRVVEANRGEATLWSEEVLAWLPYDRDGGNDWRTSSLRAWLNGDFLENCFTDAERAELTGRMVEQTHPLVLPNRFREQAERGEVYFSCSHLARLADRDGDRAFQLDVTDAVTLPTTGTIAQLAREGYDVSGDYWLETSYCPSAGMSRRLGEDGHVTLSPVDTVRGVRPMVTVVWTETAGGDGSLGHPFVLR